MSTIRIMLLLSATALAGCAAVPAQTGHATGAVRDCPRDYEPPAVGRVIPWNPGQGVAHGKLVRGKAPNATRISFTDGDLAHWLTGCDVILGEKYSRTDNDCPDMRAFSERSRLAIRSRGNDSVELAFKNVRVDGQEYGSSTPLVVPAHAQRDGDRILWLIGMFGDTDFYVYMQDTRTRPGPGPRNYKAFTVDVFPARATAECNAHRPQHSLCDVPGKTCLRTSDSHALISATAQGDTGGGHEPPP
jgi:hypothetical protein